MKPRLVNEFLWVGDARYEPRRQHRGDAGYDLVVQGDWTIEPGGFVDVPHGIERVQLPEGVWALICGRSSTLRRRRLLVVQGVIDQGYRGPLFCGVQNLSAERMRIRDGERIAQLIPLPLESARLVLRQTTDDDIEVSDRDAAGFGSTGA